jgi:hypothetical protein
MQADFLGISEGTTWAYMWQKEHNVGLEGW